MKTPIAMLAAVATVASVLAAGSATAQPQADAPSLMAAPKRIHRTAHGSVRQVVPDRPVPRPAGPRGPDGAGDPARAANAHITDIERIFVADPSSNLLVQKVSRRGSGTTVRFTQAIGSVPVYGAGVALALQADGSLLSATGALAEQTVGEYPGAATVPTAAAHATAVAKAAELAGVPVGAVRVRAASAAWYDPELSGSGSGRAAIAAYRFDIAAGEGGWRVFVAAGSPDDVLDAWKVGENLNRVICDAELRGDEEKVDIPCGAEGSYPVVRAEGKPAVTGNDDANKVYDWIGDTENFYARYTGLGSLTDLIGIDAHDGRGKALRADVRVCLSACPYANAFWSDAQGFVMGTAVLGLDVVAHELTHGVTEKTSDLDYLNESGAINESLSDVFGEFTELSARGKHAAKDRWKIGNGTQVGVIRDMKSPAQAADPQPEIYQGPGWASATYSDRNRVPDRGGVHINSGVGNKLAYLITDGDTFNGATVKGLGLEKTAALYWTVETELYPGADYPALASTLLTACRNAVEDISLGFTETDCDQVRKAIGAVRIPVTEDRA